MEACGRGARKGAAAGLRVGGSVRSTGAALPARLGLRYCSWERTTRTCIASCLPATPQEAKSKENIAALKAEVEHLQVRMYGCQRMHRFT